MKFKQLSTLGVMAIIFGLLIFWIGSSDTLSIVGCSIYSIGSFMLLIYFSEKIKVIKFSINRGKELGINANLNMVLYGSNFYLILIFALVAMAWGYMHVNGLITTTAWLIIGSLYVFATLFIIALSRILPLNEDIKQGIESAIDSHLAQQLGIRAENLPIYRAAFEQLVEAEKRGEETRWIGDTLPNENEWLIYIQYEMSRSFQQLSHMDK